MAADEWNVAIAGYLEWLAAGGSPGSTRTLRRHHLQRFAGDMGRRSPWAVDGATLTWWLASHEWAPETRRSHRSSLAGFYSWGLRSGRIARDPLLDVPRARPGHHLPRPCPDWALDHALEHADERVRLMLRLAALQGLRRAEIAQVRSDDVERDLAGWSLLVRGKGARERLMPCDEWLAQVIVDAGPGWVFPGRDRGHLSPPRVGELIAATLPPPWTAHTLRHRFATRAYHGTRDLVAVQALMGHSKPETTLRYLQLPDQAMRAALHAAA